MGRPTTDTPAGGPELARQLGLFDATMIVMGGIVGSGIFINPYIVAREVPSRALVLAAWGCGGLIALAGAFLYAELAARRPAVGGQYAYLREAFHPLLGFSYGWALLLVVQTGGMAAVALTFANYLREMTGWPKATDPTVAALTLIALTVVNCLGVRAGSTTQAVLMMLKIGALAALIACGLLLPLPEAAGVTLHRTVGSRSPLELLGDFGGAMVPVLFAYGGWQTASFVAGEMRQPRRDLPRGLLIGVVGVVALYLLVNYAYLRVLGVDGLAATEKPASEVMQALLGDLGARLMATGIAVSTVGFLSQGMLAAPRVYYAMAADGLFFRFVGRLHPGSRAPVAAIALQGVAAVAIALSGRYDEILSYVVPVDWIFITLTACSLFVLRRRDAAAGVPAPGFRMPLHPWSTGLLVLAGSLLVGNTLLRHPVNTAIGLGIMAAGVPAYLLWRRRAPGQQPERQAPGTPP